MTYQGYEGEIGNGVYPAMTFMISTQIILLLDFFISFRHGLSKDLAHWLNKRDAYDAIRSYLEEAHDE